MKLKYIFILLSILLLPSCIKDYSTTRKHCISKIIFKNNLKSIYTADRWQELVIEAPEIEQKGKEKELSYEWEINYKIVSKERVLQYNCPDFGIFNCRLKISNGDEIKYIQFQIDVQYSYIDGLYILAEKDDNTILSYLPADKNKVFEVDVLKKNNSNLNFAYKPIAMTYVEYKEKAYIYIATNEPKIYHLDANLMMNIRELTPPNEPRNIWAIDKYLNVISKNEFIYIDLQNNLWRNTNFRNNIKPVLKENELSLSPLYARFGGVNKNVVYGTVYYDNEHGHLIGDPDSREVIPADILAGQFNGYKLIAMTSIDNFRKLGLFLEKNGTITYKQVDPGEYNTKWDDIQIVRPASIMFSYDIKESDHFTKNSVVTSTVNSNLIYYATENKIYGYSILSSGNFGGDALFTVGEGEKVVKMFVADNDSKLYVATNSENGQMQGNIYCFNIESNANTLLFSKKNLTGKIVDFLYRSK